MYFVISGKLALKGYILDTFDTIGRVGPGDTAGEEGIYEVHALRKDTAVAE
jgi:hypothetical protein